MHVCWDNVRRVKAGKHEELEDRRLRQYVISEKVGNQSGTKACLEYTDCTTKNLGAVVRVASFVRHDKGGEQEGSSEG